MKLLMAVAAALALTACGSNPTTETMQVQYVKSCVAYKGGLDAANTLDKAGKLTPAQVTAVSAVLKDTASLCECADAATCTMPADVPTALAKVTAAVTTLTVNQLVKGATK